MGDAVDLAPDVGSGRAVEPAVEGELAAPLDQLGERDLVTWWTGQVEPAVLAAGGRPFACLVTEPAANTFPALPVREGEHVLVGLVG